MAERAPLPDSVLVQVLALLPLRDRLRAARVCRRWQQLAQDRAVWTHVDLSPHRVRAACPHSGAGGGHSSAVGRRDGGRRDHPTVDRD
uniref:Uncharacterized protein n=1 Tax=Corvus moneduloides TaxID=1196302 RepID=A0A8C3DI76_CORMO